MDEFEFERDDKVSDFQKKYNVAQKNLAAVVGKYLTLFLCAAVPLLLVATIWTEFGEVVFSEKMISEGVFTVALFLIGETLMCSLGCEGGRLDPSYVSSKNDVDDLVAKVAAAGTSLLTVFCEWQIDLEMEQAIRCRLRALRMGREEYESVKDDTPEELRAKYGRVKARKIMDITELKPIELNESILLYSGGYVKRGGIPKSGDEYLRGWPFVIEMIGVCVFAGLLTIYVFFIFTSDVSVARLIYTLFKLTVLLYRMAKGYGKGARAYNTVEVRMNKAKSNYLRQYLKFIEEKTYLRLGDKYGDISDIIPEEPITAEN